MTETTFDALQKMSLQRLQPKNKTTEKILVEQGVILKPNDSFHSFMTCNAAVSQNMTETTLDALQKNVAAAITTEKNKTTEKYFLDREVFEIKRQFLFLHETQRCSLPIHGR